MPDPRRCDDPAAIEAAKKQPAIVDVTMRLQQGEQYFVNRITFVGNTTTRDNVDPPRGPAARERRLQHRGAQVQRQANQSARLLQGNRGRARQPEGREGARPEEQGRRHAEVRGAEPEPAHLRRRRLAVRGLLRPALVLRRELPRPRRERDVRRHGRARRSRTTSSPSAEPYLFDRPITAGVNLFKREIRYYLAYTAGLDRRQPHDGLPACATSRGMFMTYTLEVAQGEGRQPGVSRPGDDRAQPVPGRRAAGRRGRCAGRSARSRPSLVHNTIDNPIFPNAGQALHARLRLRRRRRRRQLHQAARRRRRAGSRRPGRS